MPGPPKGRSKDPSQQHLRDQKRSWNTAYKEFSQKLKAFKDGLNGRGNAQHGIQPSNIKDPLPSEIGSILGQLASEFQNLVSGAEAISREQSTYSQSRKQKGQKPALAPVEGPNEASKALSRLSSFNFDKNASSGISRFWQYAKGLFSFTVINKQRILLLKQSATLYKAFLDLENNMLSFGISSIPKSMASYRKTIYSIEIFKRTIESTVEKLTNQAEKQQGAAKPPVDGDKTSTKPVSAPQQKPSRQVSAPPPIQEKPDEPPSLDDEMNTIEDDLHLILNSGLPLAGISEAYGFVVKYKEEQDPLQKKLIADMGKQMYTGLIKSLVDDAKKKLGPVQVSSLQDLLKLMQTKSKIEKKQSEHADQLLKLAHSGLSRYLKKQLVKSLPFNSTAAPRLEIVEIIKDIKILLNTLMDSLEKELDVEALIQGLEDLQEDMQRMRAPIHMLSILYEEDFLNKELEKKHPASSKGPGGYRDPYMESAIKSRIRNEYKKDLSNV
jgi:hypothetical protein